LAEVDAEASQTTPSDINENQLILCPKGRLLKTGAQLVDKTWIRVNDPSAGSPTER